MTLFRWGEKRVRVRVRDGQVFEQYDDTIAPLQLRNFGYDRLCCLGTDIIVVKR